MTYAERIRQLLGEVEAAAAWQPVFNRAKYEHSVAALKAAADALEAQEQCAHEWKWIKDWEGDPNVINGVRHFSYWQCTKCDSTDCDDDPPGPDPDYQRDREQDDRLTGD